MSRTRRGKPRAKHGAVWVVTGVDGTTKSRFPGAILACFTKKALCHTYIKKWLPRRAYKYPFDAITVYRFPLDMAEWRSLEAPFDIVTHEFLEWNFQRERWEPRARPLTTLGAILDLGPDLGLKSPPSATIS